MTLWSFKSPSTPPLTAIAPVLMPKPWTLFVARVPLVKVVLPVYVFVPVSSQLPEPSACTLVETAVGAVGNRAGDRIGQGAAVEVRISAPL